METTRDFTFPMTNGDNFDGTPNTLYVKTNHVSGDELKVASLLCEKDDHAFGKVHIGMIAIALNSMGSHEIHEKPRKKTTTRKVYQIIRNLREDGFPIVGDKDGVWIADSVSEVEYFAEHLEQKARSDIKSMLHLRRKMLAIVQSDIPSLFDNVSL